MSWVPRGSEVLVGRTTAGLHRSLERLGPDEWIHLCRSPNTEGHLRAEGVHPELVSFEHSIWQRGQ